MKRRIILIVIFTLLIAVTAVGCLVGAIRSYQYDMDPANGVDIMEGMGAAMLIIVGGFAIFYELDLFYTVYYFVVKPKTWAQSILNILANGILFLVFFSDLIAYFLFSNSIVYFLWSHLSEFFGEEIYLTFGMMALYLILRLVNWVVSVYAAERAEDRSHQET